MSRKFITLLLAFVIVLVTFTGAVAIPYGPYESIMAVQNMSDTSANCSYVFYDATGAAAYTSGTTSVNAQDSMFVYTNAIGSLGSGEYSGVVSCNQVVNAISFFGSSTSDAGYRGVLTPATTWYAPGIYNSYFSFFSNIVVQNASGGLVDINVDIYAEGNGTPVATQSATDVPSMASTTFEQTGLGGLNPNVPHSAVITAFEANTSTPANIAVIVNIWGTDDSGGSGFNTQNEVFSYTAFSAGATKWYTPVNMIGYYSWDSALVIQNITGSSVNVTVDYDTGDQDLRTIPGYSAASIYLPSQSTLDPGTPPAGRLAGATITSNTANSIVVMVNESNADNRAATYTGLTGGALKAYGAMAVYQASGYDLSVTCQNLGAGSTDITLEYIGSGVSPITRTGIGAGETELWFSPNDGLTAGYVGSVVVTSTAESIGCTVNRANNGAASGLDTLGAYEGVTP